MPIEFNYAQGRAQARLGERLTPAAWQLLEASGTLAQYLHAARATALRGAVRSLAGTSSPHAIERALRSDWRAEVLGTTQWVPGRWRDAVARTASLCDLPMLAWLDQGGEILPWMRDDPRFADGAGSLAGSDDMLAAWRQHFETLWPPGDRGTARLREFVDLVDEYRSQPLIAAAGRRASMEPRRRLDAHAVRLIRRSLREPVTVFSHLLLVALDLGRLRNGLVRRALFGDWAKAA
ncbi:MAG: hypothetical protein KJP08_01170 [Gammaproteobacteria bacterium]|nr:hypothetical protein [Gammaproteobacteria bacterium]MBT8093394.1 hypothetical protein [Gammaproteobacteria bacterium]